MDKESTLHFFCGKMAAGKSTLARKLANENGAILLIEDDWLSQLYPVEINTIADYIQYAPRLRNAISNHVISLLSHGVSVVMDFSANTVTQRQWFRELFIKSHAAHKLHFLDISDEICKRQLRKRSEGKPEGAAFTSESEFEAITRYFQPPLDSEGFNLVKYQQL